MLWQTDVIQIENLKGKEMISKELLSEVLNDNISEIDSINNTVQYRVFGKDYKLKSNTRNMNLYETISIHELAHKCKEWALSYGYEISSRLDKQAIATSIVWLGFAEQTTQNATNEPEVVFKACQFILDNKDRK